MIEQFEQAGRALADPSRIRILKLLEPGELCVCQITTVLGLATATISKHLSVLRAAGLLQQRREGKWVYYRLAEREINPYAPAFLHLLAAALNDEPLITGDREALARVNAVPLQVLCDQGRAVLGARPASACEEPT